MKPNIHYFSFIVVSIILILLDILSFLFKFIVGLGIIKTL